MPQTKYAVLHRKGDDWSPLVTVEAASADAAIRKVASTVGDGEYVAIPARSWAPQVVKTQQTVKVTFQ